jgi:hypothetical protein
MGTILMDKKNKIKWKFHLRRTDGIRVPKQVMTVKIYDEKGMG